MGSDLRGTTAGNRASGDYISQYHELTRAAYARAGEVDSPTLGHFQSLELGVNWRTITGNVTGLAAPKAHHLEARGSIQRYDAGAGEYKNIAVKAVMKATPKKGGLGSMEVGQPQGNESTFEVQYLKVSLDGTTEIEIDKYNFICNIAGTDYLADVREHLGIG